jgi:hypothetical protein
MKMIICPDMYAGRWDWDSFESVMMRTLMTYDVTNVQTNHSGVMEVCNRLGIPTKLQSGIVDMAVVTFTKRQRFPFWKEFWFMIGVTFIATSVRIDPRFKHYTESPKVSND